MKIIRFCLLIFVLAGMLSIGLPVRAANISDAVSVSVDWQQRISQLKTNLTVEVTFEPPMRRGGPIHDQAVDALRDLHMNYARLQPWFPYPKLSVAELDQSANGKTFWDFSLMDPMLLDFYRASEGRPILLDIAATPGWLFKAPPPPPIPGRSEQTPLGL